MRETNFDEKARALILKAYKDDSSFLEIYGLCLKTGNKDKIVVKSEDMNLKRNIKN